MIIPSSTYRIQFNRNFNFGHLASIVDYLDDLGITAIYASPILQAAKESEHGYDGIDASIINNELGTIEELEALSATLQEKGMGWIQDIVPNHLAFDTNNVWLKDVLERGINSPYARYFDIDWDHPFYQNKLMVPFLEAPLSECIQQDKLKLEFSPQGFFFAYSIHRYPVSFETYPLLLSGVFEDEFNHVNAGVSALLNNTSADYEHWNCLKDELLTQLTDEKTVESIRQRVRMINDDPSLFSAALSSQHYVLIHHVESHTQINYRRFFNVNGLICLRIEDEQVFNDYHRLIHQLYEKGIIHGLRIDHIDGLKDPKTYIDRLRQLFGKDCYIIVEKILDIKEHLPASFDIEGTSGYEFLSYINQVLTDTRGAEQLLKVYNRYSPKFNDYDAIVYNNKLDNLVTYLNGEWDNLLRLLLSLNLIEDEEIRMADLKMALGAFMAGFPVYRAYINQLPLEQSDMQMVEEGFSRALRKYRALHYELGVLRELFNPHEDQIKNTNRLLFIQRLMQFTGPLAAKGVEDTTFYQYNALISHNEVGDQPCVLGIPVKEFHEKMQERQLKNPLSFNCTSTHDTKRGEDGRIRINIISELADEWTGLVKQWQLINEPFRKQAGQVKAPVVNDEYFLYQAILGGFPEDLVVTQEFKERTKKYFIKVLRESKLMSDYVNPNTAYEEASIQFIDHLLNSNHSFLPSFQPFVEKVIQYANTYTMVQIVIKTTSPGIPDIYRGCELWDISYVDPDNRRPVDYDLRKRLLKEMKEKKTEGPDAALAWANDNYIIGAEKFLVTREMLQIRKKHPRLFVEGDYIPVYAEGNSNRIVFSYLRHFNGDWLLVVLPLGIVANKGKSVILKLPPEAPQHWKNIFTGETFSGDLDVAKVWEKFDVAVLRPVKG
jgi:(1->4)-alpha-D-glucan 1-alpha-D-glucosylmutase